MLQRHSLASDVKEAKTRNVSTFGKQTLEQRDSFEKTTSERRSVLEEMKKPWKFEEPITAQQADDVAEAQAREQEQEQAQALQETYAKMRADNQKHWLKMQELSRETNGYIIASHNEAYLNTMKMRDEGHKLFMQAITGNYK